MNKHRILGALLFLFLLIPSFAKEYQKIENLSQFQFKIIEKDFHQGKEKELHYSLKISLPHLFRKEVSYPKLNEGEVYFYTGKEKKVYLPIFKQTKVTAISENDNEILNTIQALFQKMKTDNNLRKNYYAKKETKVELEKGYVILLKSFVEIGDYLFPQDWEIQDQGKKIASLHFSEITLNPGFQEKDFQVP